ncbi:hypothetical protein P1X14_19250 [Sphingomonas sp. AOB5]|uniref:hypothetical protein n=1 Tax=Sphingomonas sp. AOB5 TaxID=3034017 RepID=UPI0023F9F0B0|nr:hypothetical protein [Sphingomonas sp. AOB5]MDF7777402.1 hypothetical protein [Sphingomonas sp. AOB5]
MKLFVLLLPLLAQSTPRPAWEIADRWECNATQLRICKGPGDACELSDNEARFRIDFTKNKLLIADDPDGERITTRYFWPGGYSRGFTKIGLETGDTLALGTGPVEGKPDTYAMVMTRADPGSQYSFFGACRPVK